MIGAFYYVRYGGPTANWQAWRAVNKAAQFDAPLDIASDFWPVLGPYDSRDPAVVDQHLAWAAAAGIDVFVVSILRRDAFEEAAIDVLVQRADRTPVRICFSIGAYPGRTAETVAADIAGIYARYGHHPSFLWVANEARHCPGHAAKGLFFIWAAHVRNVSFFPVMSGERVPATYWTEMVDALHHAPVPTLLVANPPATRDSVLELIEHGHFDGLFNYTHREPDAFAPWAAALPAGAAYVPCVMPGYSARKIGYRPETYLPRSLGATYDAQWTAALAAGVDPLLVVVTTFNEWNEGTQIEPAVPSTDGPADRYLTATRRWAEHVRSNRRTLLTAAG